MGKKIKSFSNRQGGGKMSPLAFGFIFFLIFGGIGLFILKLSYSEEIETNNLINICTEETEGKVVSIRTEKKYKTVDKRKTSYYLYYPTISYNADNVKITNEHHSARTSSVYTEGQKLTIIYDPNNPETYYIKGIDDKSQTPARITACVVILIGLLIFIAMINENRKIKKKQKVLNEVQPWQQL